MTGFHPNLLKHPHRCYFPSFFQFYPSFPSFPSLLLHYDTSTLHRVFPAAGSKTGSREPGLDPVFSSTSPNSKNLTSWCSSNDYCIGHQQRKLREDFGYT